MKERSTYSVSIKANNTGAIESYDIDLRNLGDHAQTPYDPLGLVRVLNMVFSADQKAYLSTASLAIQPFPDENVNVRWTYHSSLTVALIDPHSIVCYSPLCDLRDASLRSNFKYNRPIPI